MPQPIDLNTETARQLAAERVQDVASRLSLAAQQRLAIQDQDERIQRETQVQPPGQPEQSQVDREAKRRNPYAAVRKRKKTAGTAPASETVVYTAHEKTEVAGGLEGQSLDISI